MIKPDLHDDYKHFAARCWRSSTNFFGDDLPKHVKELTDVNRVGKKVSTHSGRLTTKPAYNRHNYAHSRGRLGNQQYRKPFLGSWKRAHKHSLDFRENQSVSVKCLTCVDNVEARNISKQSIDSVGGRLKPFSPQWQCLLSNMFILKVVLLSKVTLSFPFTFRKYEL